MDARKRYLVNTILSCIGQESDRKENEARLAKQPELDNFIQSSDITLIEAYTDKENKIRVSNSVNPTSDAVVECHIVKKVAGPLPERNTQDHVIVTSTVGSPLYSFYLAVHNIYGPNLIGQGTMDQSLQRTLMKLDKSLAKQVLLQGSLGGKEADVEQDVGAINTFNSEFAYWTAVGTKDGHVGARGQAFAKHLDNKRTKLHERLESLAELREEEISRLVEDFHDRLSELWNEEGFNSGSAYPQIRMENLFAIVGRAFIGLAKSLLRFNLWKSPFSKLSQALSGSKQALEKWQATTTSLTSVDWPRWEGGKYDDEKISLMLSRLTDIFDIRTSTEEIQRLTPAAMQKTQDTEGLYKAFDNVDPLNLEPYMATKWKVAMDSFNSSLAKAEAEAASLLNSRFQNSDARQIVAQLRCYPSLLKRATVAKSLSLSDLSAKLLRYVESLVEQFESKSYIENAFAGSDLLSPELRQVSWANQILHKINQVASASTSCLGVMAGSLTSTSQNAQGKIREFCEQVASRRAKDILAVLSIPSSKAAQELSGKLMEMTWSKSELIVLVPDALTTLLNDFRLLTELHLECPDKVRKVAVDAERYHRFGLKLQQVASFFNGVFKEIIPSQERMLDTYVNQFQRIVNDHKNEIWDSPDQCEKYCARLMAAAEEVSQRNRKLRSVHVSLSQKIVVLMETDLQSDVEGWNEQLKQMKAIIAKEERMATSDQMLVWKNHWEQQLYKALEVQYRTRLCTLSENFESIEAEIIFSRTALAFRPALEDLRTKYYKNILKFVNLPKNFSGLGNNAVYDPIPERSADDLISLYTVAGSIFSRLESLLESYKNWVAIGTVDIEEFVEKRLSSLHEYEDNFRILEKRRREANRLPDSLKLDCFTISFQPFKSAVDDMLHSFSDALLLSLRKSSLRDLKKLDVYLSSAMERLSARPQSVSEMSKAKKEWKEIDQRKKEMYACFDLIQQKNMMMRQKASMPLDLSEIKPRWETFIISLNSFQDMMDDQKDVLRANIDKNVKELTTNIEKFVRRWESAKPKTDGDELTTTMANAILAEINDWKAEMKTMEDAVKELRDDMDHFNLECPKFDNLDKMKLDMEQHSSSWSLYDEYVKDLSAMTSEAWVAFRARIFSFEDFINNWRKKLKGREKDIVFKYIATQLKKTLLCGQFSER